MISIGFIGFGKMAQAIVEGWSTSSAGFDLQVSAYAPHQDKLKASCRRFGATPCSSAIDVCHRADTIILACKPAQVAGVLEEIKDALADHLVISLAAGISAQTLEGLIPGVAYTAVMPNTAMAVHAGTLVVEEPNTMSEQDRKRLYELFEPLGSIVEVPSSLFGIAGTLSGCGPAFLGLFAEAMADAGVKYGLPRATAARLSASVVYGAGAMLLKDGAHPSVFKDEICSPGGTTIRGIVTLEKDGFRKAVIEAIEAIQEKK